MIDEKAANPFLPTKKRRFIYTFALQRSAAFLSFWTE